MKKMMFFTLCLIATVIISGNSFAQLTIYTEEFPPYQYTEEGKLTGASAEIVQALLALAQMDYEIKVYPWARTYKVAQEAGNSLIFSISRRENREQLFKWIGIIVPSRSSIFRLKERNDIVVSNLEDMKSYKIGTSKDDAREAYLLNKGFAASDLDTVVGENANLNNYKKLKAGRIDLWPMPDAVAYHTVRKEGDDPEALLARALPMTEISSGGYYIAASLQTDDAVVSKLKEALDAFVTTQEYKDILAKYGL